MYPALPAPHRERLAGINAKPVQVGIAVGGGEFRPGEPAPWKLTPAVGDVFAAEDTQAQHFRWRQIGAELVIKVAAGRRDEDVSVAPLHPIVDGYGSFFQRDWNPSACPGTRGSANPLFHMSRKMAGHQAPRRALLIPVALALKGP